MKEVTYSELLKWKEKGIDIELIDVREPWEFEDFNIGGKLLPLGEIVPRKTEIEVEGKSVVFVCRAGVRSMIAIQRLQPHFPEIDMYNFKGGLSSIIE